MPENLKILHCANNKIRLLDNLPNSLIKLFCSENPIESIDFLPASLKILHCELYQNPYKKTITNFSNYFNFLPIGLEKLYCEEDTMDIISIQKKYPNIKINNYS